MICNASKDSTRSISLRKKIAYIESNVDRKVGYCFLSPKAVFKFTPCLNCSSECSNGEGSTCVPSYSTAVEKEQSSSDESWETVPCREKHDPEPQMSSSGVKEESVDFRPQEGYAFILLASFL